MNPQIPLYQFVQDKDRISIARIAGLEIKPAPNNYEAVSLDLAVEEDLAVPGPPPVYSYKFERSTNVLTRVKMPDPIWAGVTLQKGNEVLLVTSRSETPPPGARNPVYAEDIPARTDPVLQAIREVLHGELARETDAEHYEQRMRWLSSDNTVEKLYAGEVLAKNGGSGDPPLALIRTFAHAFLVEQDEYVAMSLGAWLWENLYPRVTHDDGRIIIVNATITAAASKSPYVRDFVVDKLSAIDPKLLNNPKVQASAEAIAELEGRYERETDPASKESLHRVIEALHR